MAPPTVLPKQTDRFIKFEVTADDIAAVLWPPLARDTIRYSCPVARAVKRAVGKNVSIGFGYADIYWVYGERGVHYKHKYGGVVADWDNSGNMTPFSGVLEHE